MSETIPEVVEIRRVTLDPGDVLVARATQRISMAAADLLMKRLREAFPDNRVLVVDGSIEFDVMTTAAPSPDREPEPTPSEES